MQDKIYAIYQKLEQVNRVFFVKAVDCDLTPGEAVVIKALEANPNGLHPSKIGEVVGISRPSLTALLRALEDKGCIERLANRDDGRKYVVTLAAQYLARRDGERAQRAQRFACALKSLSEHELALLQQLVQRLPPGDKVAMSAD